MFVSVFVDLDGGECTDTTENIKFSVHEIFSNVCFCVCWRDGGECTDTTENIKFSVHETSRFRCIYW